MKEAEHKVVTPFINPAESKARAQIKPTQSSEDIHVGPNTQLSGGFHTHGMMIVDGQVDNADISADRLVLSHIGKLEGKVSVHRAELSGVFDGELVAGDEVIVRPTAKLAGSVRCQKLVIHRGARIECTFSCAPEAGPESAPADTAASAVRSVQQWRNNLGSARDQRLLLTGAGAVFAGLGVIGLLVALKMVIS